MRQLRKWRPCSFTAFDTEHLGSHSPGSTIDTIALSAAGFTAAAAEFSRPEAYVDLVIGEIDAWATVVWSVMTGPTVQRVVSLRPDLVRT